MRSRGSRTVKPFTIVGRLQLSTGEGTWDEWHVALERRRLRVARRGAGRLLDDAAAQAAVRARLDAARTRPVPRPRRVRPLRGRRGPAGHVRLGRGRPPVRRAARLRLPVRGHFGRRRLARHARLRRRPGPRRLLRRAEARARRPRHRGPHGLEGPQVLREGAGAELPRLRRRARAEGPREHGPHRLHALRVDPRRQGREEPAGQVRGHPQAHGGPVQAFDSAGLFGRPERPSVHRPRRRPEGDDVRRDDVSLGRVPAQGAEERGLPLARGVERPLHASRARAGRRRRGDGPLRDVQRRALPDLLAQQRERARGRRRVLLGGQEGRDDDGDGLRRAAADALERIRRLRVRMDRRRLRPAGRRRGRLSFGGASLAVRRGRGAAVAARGHEPSVVEDGPDPRARRDRRLRGREGHRAETGRVRPHVRPRRQGPHALRRARLGRRRRRLGAAVRRPLPRTPWPRARPARKPRPPSA